MGWKEAAEFTHRLKNSPDDYIIMDVACRVDKEEANEQKAAT